MAAAGAGLFPNVPSGNARSGTQVTLSRPEPSSSFEAGEGSTFPVELPSAVSGTLFAIPPTTLPPSFLPLRVPASGRALPGKALGVCATPVQRCSWGKLQQTSVTHTGVCYTG